jgi:hypothetical protein
VRSPLADAIRGQRDSVIPTRARVGTVTSTSPLKVALAGQSGLSAARSNLYTPVLNDTVLIIQLEPDLIIMCSIISGG